MFLKIKILFGDRKELPEWIKFIHSPEKYITIEKNVNIYSTYCIICQKNKHMSETSCQLKKLFDKFFL